jgi:hypothetical protein
MRSAVRLLGMLLVLALSACAREPVIRTDFDQTADFSRYRTFGFDQDLGTDSGAYSSILTQRLKSAVLHEMVARGYIEQSDAPDLLVNFHSGLKNKVRVTSTPAFWGPWPYDIYGYGGGIYGRWTGGYPGWTEVENYTLGSLSIDLVDRVRRQLVWQGVATSEVDDFAEAAPSDQEVAQRIAKIFEGYPFRAAPS